MKLKAKAREVKGSVSRDEKPMVEFVPSGADIGRPKGLTYEDVDPEGMMDEHIERSGMYIVSSTIELTDSSGNNRTYVKDIRKPKDRGFRPITQLD